MLTATELNRIQEIASMCQVEIRIEVHQDETYLEALEKLVDRVYSLEDVISNENLAKVENEIITEVMSNTIYCQTH